MSAHYEMGREARIAGRGSNTCPFARGGPEWVQWMDGWNRVDFEYRVQAARKKEPEVAFEKAEAPICPNCGEPGVHYLPGEGFQCKSVAAYHRGLQNDDSAGGDDAPASD